MKLTHKLTGTLVAASIVPMIFLGLIAYSNAELIIRQKTLRELEIIADFYMSRMSNYVERGGSEESLWQLVRDNAGLGVTGEIVIAKRNESGGATFLASSRFQKDPSTLEPMSGENLRIPILQALQRNAGIFSDLMNYRNAPVLAVTRYFEDRDWGLAVQIDLAEVIAPLRTLRLTLLIMGAIVLGFSILMAYLSARAIAVPVQRLTQEAGKIASGSLDNSGLVVESDDEIGKLANAFSSMTDELRDLYEGLEAKVKERTKQLADALQDVRKFQLAVESSTDAVMIATTENKIIYVNPAWEHQTGYSRREIVGREADMLNQDETNISSLADILTAIQNGETFHSEDVKYTKKDGRQYDVETSIFPIFEKKGKPQFFVEIHNDITLRKKEEQAKNQFVSLASHQLRTPLTAIRWAMGRLQRVLKKKGMGEDEEHILDAAHKGAKTMAEIIATMLTLSRIASGKIKFNPQSCNLDALVQEVSDLYAGQCTEEKKSLNVAIPPDLTIETDEKLLREIISNLTSNAIKYSPEGSSVDLSIEPQGKESVLIEIRDHGYGIPKEEQKNVFSIFFRADNVQEKKIEGTGLGLYLVYSLAEFIGGTITFASEENKGTTFSLTLPVSPTPDD